MWEEFAIAPEQESGAIIFLMNRKFNEGEWLRLIRGEIFFIFYGLIEYTDTFHGRIHQSRFCYRFDFRSAESEGFNYLFGPEEYNEYT